MDSPSLPPFREWMELLKQPRGTTAEWPYLLRRVLTDTYLRGRATGAAYAGEVFKDRDADFPFRAVLPEKKAVKELFHHCREAAGGVLAVGGERYWLQGYEWPNQGGDGEKGRRADLIGLTAAGGLVVFECKLLNDDGPLLAVLESLDYLSHLTARPNFSKVEDGFRRRTEKPQTVRPAGFEGIVPAIDARHEVVVLASPEYSARHRRSRRSSGWEWFAALPPEPSPPLAIRFAESDFTSALATWVAG